MEGTLCDFSHNVPSVFGFVSDLSLLNYKETTRNKVPIKVNLVFSVLCPYCRPC